MSREFWLKGVPKVIREENRAPSTEVLPQVVVQPPKREKKRSAGPAGIVQGAHGAGMAQQKDGLRAVLLLHPLQFSGDLIQGFFPGYGLELTAPPVPRPFQRNPETVRGVQDFPLGQSAGTGLQTGAGLVIGRDPFYLSFLHLNLEKTAGSAVKTASRGISVILIFHGTTSQAGGCGERLDFFNKENQHFFGKDPGSMLMIGAIRDENAVT